MFFFHTYNIHNNGVLYLIIILLASKNFYKIHSSKPHFKKFYTTLLLKHF